MSHAQLLETCSWPAVAATVPATQMAFATQSLKPVTRRSSEQAPTVAWADHLLSPEATLVPYHSAIGGSAVASTGANSALS